MSARQLAQAEVRAEAAEARLAEAEQGIVSLHAVAQSLHDDLSNERDRRVVAQEAITQHWQPRAEAAEARLRAMEQALSKLAAAIAAWDDKRLDAGPPLIRENAVWGCARAAAALAPAPAAPSEVRMQTASESVGWLNSEGPLNVVPDALRKYGKHAYNCGLISSCRYTNECTCGLDDALAPAPAAPGSPRMSDLQQIAETLAQRHCNSDLTWSSSSGRGCSRCAVIAAAIEAALREAQREALEQAANDVATGGFVNTDGFPIDVSSNVIADWLRARAAALGKISGSLT